MKIEDKWKVILDGRTYNGEIFSYLASFVLDKPKLEQLYYKGWGIDDLINPKFNEATNEFHMFVHLLYKIIKENDNI